MAALSNPCGRSITVLSTKRMLEYQRAYRQQSWPAALEALNYCLEDQLCPPLWVLEAARIAFIQLSTLERTTGKRGRSASTRAMNREARKHYARAETVNEIREKQSALRQELARIDDDARRFGDSSKLREVRAEQRALQKRFGRTWEDAYRAASEELKGTPQSGTPEAMRASYQRVVRDMRDPSKRGQYMLLNERTVKATKLDEKGQAGGR